MRWNFIPKRRQKKSQILSTGKQRFKSALIEPLESRTLLSAISWINSSGGAWGTGSNWSGGVTPGAGDDVTINQPGNIAIILTGSDTISSLSITGDSLAITGGTLTTTGNVSNSGSITVNPGAKLAVGGSYTESSTATLRLPPGTPSGSVGANLLSGPGFESPSAGGSSTTSPSGWGTWSSSYVSTLFAQSGLQSLQLSGTNSGVYQSFSATPGVSYIAQVEVMMPSTTPLTGPEGAWMSVYFYNSSGTQLTSTAANHLTLLTSTSATGGPISGSVGGAGWNFFTTTIVAPVTSVKMELFLQVGAYTGHSGTAGGDAYFDDAALGPAGLTSAAVTAASMANSGTINLGMGGTIAITGGFTQTSSGILNEQLGGPPGSGFFGALTASGAASLAGTFNATIINAYSPAQNDGFNVLTFTSETGTFSSINLPSGASYQFVSTTSPTYFGIGAILTQTSATINAGSISGSAYATEVGVNLAYWDDKLNTTQTAAMVQAAGLQIFRFPGGSASDDFHFNVSNNYGDSAANTIPQFAKFIEGQNATGIVTLDYGSGSPQEAEAELAYLLGSPTDTTVIGNGMEWSDGAKAWQTVNWQTVGYWASLRAASPLATDDGYNFLRINHAGIFSGIKYWEVGNELYGSWETDHHGTAGPGGVSTGAQHDPATYAAFAAAFGSFISADQANLPAIKIGIDSGDPTGASDGNWTKNVLAAGAGLGFVPGFISDHSYMYGPGSESDSLLLNHTVSDPTSNLDWSVRYADYEAMLQATVGASAAAGVQVMATEYNSNYGVEGKQMTSLVNGLFVADSIGSLLDSGYSAGLFWDLRNGWTTSGNNSANLYGWRQGGDEGILGDPNNTSDAPSTGPYVAYPSYYAEQLLSKLAVAGGQVISAVSNYSELATYAVFEANGHLEILVINKNPDAAINEQFNLQGFVASGAASIWQYGEAQDYAQSLTTNGASALAHFTTTLAVSNGQFSYSLPAYSMTVIDLAPNPTVSQAAAANPNPVTGKTTTLTALGSENGSAVGLLYTWSATGPASVLYSDNGTTTASSTTATFSQAGQYTFTVTISDGGGASVTSKVIVNVNQTLKGITVSGPSNATAGNSFAFTVTAFDQFGNTDTGYTGTVHFTSTDGSATLPADSTLTSGTGSFNATLDTAGLQTITGTDTSNSSITDATNTITVGAATATHFTVGAPPNVTAGNSFNFTITALDQFGNTSTGYTGTVHFTSSDGAAVLPADATLSNGTGTFSATLNTPGGQTITATDTTTSSIKGTTGTIAVSSVSVPSKLVFTKQPTNSTAHVALPSFAVSIENQFGSVLTTDTSIVTIALYSGTPGTLYGTASVHAVKGVATFNGIFLLKAGTYELVASDSTDAITGGPSNSFKISAGAAAKLAFAARPANVVAGVNESPVPVVYVEDAWGNVVTTDNSLVTLGVKTGPSGSGGGIFGNFSLDASSGVATFSSVYFKSAGVYTLSANDGALTSAASQTFTVSAGTVASLAFVINPTNAVAGQKLAPFTVAAVDQYGNAVAHASITLSAAGPGGLFGTITISTGSNGIATFSSVSLHIAGAYTLTAKYSAISSAPSSSFTISPAAASKLVFTKLPVGAVHGNAFSAAVSVEDTYGNVITTQNTGTITLSQGTHPTGSVLGGTLTVNVVNGVATFSNLTVTKSGSYSLKAADSFAIAGITSATFAVG